MVTKKKLTVEGELVDPNAASASRSDALGPEMVKLLKTELKEREFAREYVKHRRNGTAAYSAISPRSTRATASVEASKLLKRPSVQLLIRDHEQDAETEIVRQMHAAPEAKDRREAAKLVLAYTKGLPVSRSISISAEVSLEDVLKANK